MHIIEPSFEILTPLAADEIMRQIERAARVCYKSEDKIMPDSAPKLLRRLIKSGHHSVIEHVSVSVWFVCDRGVSHELVRHRLAAFSQESTRYANYAKAKFGEQITVIKPCFWPEDSTAYALWKAAMAEAEKTYLELVRQGATAQQARSVLPNSLKTEIIMTCNLREWRHVLKLRAARAAHPQMRELMRPLLAAFKAQLPIFFEDM